MYKCLVFQKVLMKMAEEATKNPSVVRPLRICNLIDDCLRSRQLETVERLSKFYFRGGFRGGGFRGLQPLQKWSESQYTTNVLRFA